MSGSVIHTPHSSECYLASQGRSEYIVHDGFDMRDKNGRAYKDGRGSSWYRFKCNCIECDSVALVHWSVLMEFLAEPPAPPEVSPLRKGTV